MRRFVFVFLFAASLPLHAQWKPFFDGAVFLTHASQAGPDTSENKFFSTNWLSAGAERRYGDFTIIAGGRVSLEPFTIPKDGYPQLLQYAPPLVDHMRAQDLVQEAAIGLQWRIARLYLAPVGEPPLGADPFAQRVTSMDFAEAPFAYDVQESFHVATRVIGAGVTTNAVSVDGAVFHHSQTTGRHASIDDGDIDSWSARLTFAPHARLSAQISSGRLGDANTDVSSASMTYHGSAVSGSLLWTKNGDLHAYGVETSMRPGRSTVVGRAEWVDRPAGVFTANTRRMAHVTVGYIFDVLKTRDQRAGFGVNIDYHSSTKTLLRDYGHKPQGVYLFLRWRTEPRQTR
jgi:hypothetical protein